MLVSLTGGDRSFHDIKLVDSTRFGKTDRFEQKPECIDAHRKKTTAPKIVQTKIAKLSVHGEVIFALKSMPANHRLGHLRAHGFRDCACMLAAQSEGFEKALSGGDCVEAQLSKIVLTAARTRLRASLYPPVPPPPPAAASSSAAAGAR